MSKHKREPEVGKEDRAEMLRHTLMTAGWQKVIRPALLAAIAQTTHEVMSGERMDRDKDLDDNALKQRANALKWVLGWEQTYAQLVAQLEQAEAVRAQTEPATEGGSPY